MPKIVYLEARGTGTFRSRLRSDTLWASLCWSIRTLQDAKKGKPDDITDLIASYQEGNESAFYLSSAFPWYEYEGEKVHFLPFPLLQSPLTEGTIVATAASKIKEEVRTHKQKNKRKDWISWQHLAFSFGNGEEVPIPAFMPRVNTEPVTHNLIDRRRLGTLTTNNEGQLFHMNENYLEWNSSNKRKLTKRPHGFYFLLEGDDSLVLPALRLLSTLGIGGDRNNGKGNFKIYWEEDAHQLKEGFSLPKVANANAALNLALYHPEKGSEELNAYDQVNDHRWQYQLEDRQGRNMHQGDYLQSGRLFFKEGSVFPKEAVAKAFPGENVNIGTHQRYGHPIYRYGHAFLLDINVK